MTVTKSEVRAGAYYDSVVLMQLQRALAELPGVEDAGVVMATPANLDLLAASDLTGDFKAGSDDLLIVVKAENLAAADSALEQVDELLVRRRSGVQQSFRPRSLDSAIKQLPQAQWVLISVPGRYAAGVARNALQLGRHVFIYSDNVSLGDEIELKELARSKGLLVMGPDCGTAIISGIGFGFANRVRAGSIGLVGASGTGLQAITSSIHRLGSGISHAVGTGGRDLKASVGAVTMSQGLELLARDKDTEVIVLVSKPPERALASRLLRKMLRVEKPIVVDFIGYDPPARQVGNLYFALNLDDAANLAVELDQDRPKESAGERTHSNVSIPADLNIRGLFSGGTLAYEALKILSTFVQPVHANISFEQSELLEDVTKSVGHTILDLGEDEFTQGRLHPMMDNNLRLRRFHQEASDPQVGVILLDVVLGDGAHPDPASELAPAISEVLTVAEDRGHPLTIITVVIGTDEDGQDLGFQMKSLRDAGALVFEDVVDAISFLIGNMDADLSVDEEDGLDEVSLSTLAQPVSAVNVGLELFYDSLVAQGADCVHVDWRPPAGGNEKLMALLKKMKGV